MSENESHYWAFVEYTKEKNQKLMLYIIGKKWKKGPHIIMSLTSKTNLPILPPPPSF